MLTLYPLKKNHPDDPTTVAVDPAGSPVAISNHLPDLMQALRQDGHKEIAIRKGGKVEVYSTGPACPPGTDAQAAAHFAILLTGDPHPDWPDADALARADSPPPEATTRVPRSPGPSVH